MSDAYEYQSITITFKGVVSGKGVVYTFPLVTQVDFKIDQVAELEDIMPGLSARVAVVKKTQVHLDFESLPQSDGTNMRGFTFEGVEDESDSSKPD